MAPQKARATPEQKARSIRCPGRYGIVNDVVIGENLVPDLRFSHIVLSGKVS